YRYAPRRPPTCLAKSAKIGYRNDEVFRHVAVRGDDPIDADRFERPLRTNSSGDPANEHDVAVGRVLDRLSAEIGNEVEQIDDALGILVGPPDRGCFLRPSAGVFWLCNRRHPGQHTLFVRIQPSLPPVLDPVRTPLLRQHDFVSTALKRCVTRRCHFTFLKPTDASEIAIQGCRTSATLPWL